MKQPRLEGQVKSPRAGHSVHVHEKHRVEAHNTPLLLPTPIPGSTDIWLRAPSVPNVHSASSTQHGEPPMQITQDTAKQKRGQKKRDDPSRRQRENKVLLSPGDQIMKD